MKISKDKKHIRYQMVQDALKHGIKPTARKFHTSSHVVRKWIKRLDSEGYLGLNDRSRRPHYSPNETSRDLKEHTIMLKGKYKRLGAEQIKTLEDFPLSPKTMRKIWRNAGISSRKRRKKHVTKNNLREIKKQYKLFERMGEDTKDLIDIPEYWPQMKALNLPRVQYTFREISCGPLFLGFANNRSLTHSVLFAIYINHFLKKYNALPERSRRQTDNGSEYTGGPWAIHPSDYTKVIESLPGQVHHTIFPGAHTWQSDVETIHNLMELEFYEIESFSSRQDFINKASSYQLFFNLKRPNSYKEHKTPWQLAHEKNPNLDKQLLMIPAVDLDKLVAMKNQIKGGNDLLTLP
jgi:transposase